MTDTLTLDELEHEATSTVATKAAGFRPSVEDFPEKTPHRSELLAPGGPS